MSIKELPLIDNDRLGKLKSIFGEDYAGLLTSFIDSSQDNIAQIGIALYGHNRTQAVFAAHKFASAAAQFALPKLSALGRAIEHGEQLDNGSLLQLHAELAAAFHDATLQLRRLR